MMKRRRRRRTKKKKMMKSGRCRYSQSIMARALSRIKRVADEYPLTFRKNHKERAEIVFLFKYLIFHADRVLLWCFSFECGTLRTIEIVENGPADLYLGFIPLLSCHWPLMQIFAYRCSVSSDGAQTHHWPFNSTQS